MVLCIGVTPAAQRVMVFDSFAWDNVNRAAATIDGIAGKGINVAKVLKLLGERPVVAGFIGGPRGQGIQARLRNLRMENEFVEVTPNTRQCITVIDRRLGTQTELVEESHAVPKGKYAELMRLVKRRMQGCKAVVLSGTLTPGAPQAFYRDCIELANAAGLLTLLDAKGQALELALPAGPTVVKPNRAELSATTGRNISSDRACVAAMKQLNRRGAKYVIVTAGKGPTLCYDGNTFSKIFSPPVDVLNPIGSGDSFAAALTWRLLRGDDLSEACRWAAAAGAANALTLMPGEFELSDLNRLALRIKMETYTVARSAPN